MYYYVYTKKIHAEIKLHYDPMVTWKISEKLEIKWKPLLVMDTHTAELISISSIRILHQCIQTTKTITDIKMKNLPGENRAH